MPLPKIATPTYELVLPSSDRKIKYRPFLVKEEKILIIALESQDQKQIASAVKSILSNCILTRGTKVEKLSTFDIEYLFLNVRGKSVGEQIEVMVLVQTMVRHKCRWLLILMTSRFKNLMNIIQI